MLYMHIYIILSINLTHTYMLYYLINKYKHIIGRYRLFYPFFTHICVEFIFVSPYFTSHSYVIIEIIVINYYYIDKT